MAREWELKRDGGDGDMLVKVDGRVLVRIYYDPRFIDNARQWQLGKQIVAMLGHDDDTVKLPEGETWP